MASSLLYRSVSKRRSVDLEDAVAAVVVAVVVVVVVVVVVDVGTVIA